MRRVSILKWLLFAGAVIFSIASVDHNSAGGAAAGLWIAFALLHVNQQNSPQ